MEEQEKHDEKAAHEADEGHKHKSDVVKGLRKQAKERAKQDNMIENRRGGLLR